MLIIYIYLTLRDGSAISTYIKDDKSGDLIEIPHHESSKEDSPETTAQRYLQVFLFYSILKYFY